MNMDRPISRRKPRISKPAAIGAGLLAAAMLIWLALSLGSVGAPRVDGARLTLSVVRKGTFTDYISIVGNVAPDNSIYLDAVVGGRVEERFIEAGAEVKKGDPILRLSNTNLMMTLLTNEALVSQSLNDLRVSRLQLEQNALSLKRERADADYYLLKASQRFKRVAELAQADIASRQEYQDARDDLEYWTGKQQLIIESQHQDTLFRQNQIQMLEKSVNGLMTNLDLLRRQMDLLTVRAPENGQLTSLLAEPGQNLAMGERIGQIDRPGGFKIKALVDELYLTRVAPGQKGESDTADHPFPVSVSKIYPEVKDGKFNIDLKFIRETPPAVRRGQTLYIRLQLSDIQQPALLLERGPFHSHTGGQWIYVVAKNRTAQKKTIRLGRQNPRYFEVLEGLNEGDTVIISAYETFHDADRVIIRRK